MIARSVVVAFVVCLCVALSGCGSSGTTTDAPTPPAPDPGATFTVGTLQVGTASAAGFKTLTLDSPANLPVAFTVLYGSRIVRLREMGYGKIAFASTADGDYEIYVIGTDGSNRVKLTQNQKDDSGPSWSPDGQKIAFDSDRVGNFEVYKMNANGTGLMRLTNDPGIDGGPAWSPNGRRIAFTSSRDGISNEIYTMKTDGSGLKRLTDNSDLEFSPAWSPDGRKIVFARFKNVQWNIFIMNADGSNEVPLTASATIDATPSWSPDGSKIIFRHGKYVSTMNVDGSGITNLTSPAWDSSDPAWSPDGRQIAFVRAPMGKQGIYVMDADGANVRTLVDTPGDDHSPRWCPTPSVKRTLIGPAGSDGAKDPPFGSQKPLAVVGLSDAGLVSAATVDIGVARWPSIKVAALSHLGSRLAGLKITASKINGVQEDIGRGLGPRIWDLAGPPATGSALIFFSAETGRISSVIASSDQKLDTTQEVTTELVGDRVIVRGSFAAVYGADEPAAQSAAGPVRRVVLDGATGRVLSAD